MRIILGLILIFTLSSFGKYNLSKQDFINQFSDTLSLNRIFCYNSNGDKVWLSNLQNGILTVQDNDSKVIEYRLLTTRFHNDSLIGQLLTSSNKSKKLSLKDIISIGIIVDSPNEIAYFNLDSCKKLLKLRNDSLEDKCKRQKEIVIYLKPKTKNVKLKDSISIYENACYNIDFKNNVKVNHGVIEKITMDSIYISNSFSQNTAKQEKLDYKILKYSNSEIVRIRLMKPNGLTFLDIGNEKYNFVPTEINSCHLKCPCWFELDEYTGEISFFREWLISTGYYGVKEKDGKIYW